MTYYRSNFVTRCLPGILILLLGINLAQANGLEGRVYNVPNGHSLQIITDDQHRLLVKLPAVRPFHGDAPKQQNAQKRLESMLKGKSVSLSLLPAAMIDVRYGNASVAERMLEEGLLEIDADKLSQLSAQMQESYTKASRRTNTTIVTPTNNYPNRYYEPYWSQQRIPSPMINAPVYYPRR